MGLGTLSFGSGTPICLPPTSLETQCFVVTVFSAAVAIAAAVCLFVAASISSSSFSSEGFSFSLYFFSSSIPIDTYAHIYTIL